MMYRSSGCGIKRSAALMAIMPRGEQLPHCDAVNRKRTLRIRIRSVCSLTAWTNRSMRVCSACAMAFHSVRCNVLCTVLGLTNVCRVLPCCIKPLLLLGTKTIRYVFPVARRTCCENPPSNTCWKGLMVTQSPRLSNCRCMLRSRYVMCSRSCAVFRLRARRMIMRSFKRTARECLLRVCSIR